MPADPGYSIDIRVLTPVGKALFRGRAFYRIRFEVDAAVGMPAEVFVHQKVGTGDLQRDDFISIAGPLDLLNVPVGTVNDDGYHRLAYADLAIESITLADETVRVVRNNLQELVNGLKLLDNIVETETFTVADQQ